MPRSPRTPRAKPLTFDHVCPLDWCGKKYSSPSSLRSHIDYKHRCPSPTWTQPSASALEDFTKRAVFAIQEALSRTPKGTVGRRGSGGSEEKLVIDCSRDVFLDLFGEEQDFWCARDQSRFVVSLKGVAGMKVLEGKFGKKFWKYTFNNYHRSQCYALFHSHAWKADYAMKFAWSTKAITNHGPGAVFTREIVQITFRRARTVESEAERGKTVPFEPVSYTS